MNHSRQIAQENFAYLPLERAAQLLRQNARLAASSAREVFAQFPGVGEALALFVDSCRLGGNLRAARDTLQSLAQGMPGIAAIHYELGLLQCDMGERDAAVAAFSRVVDLEPAHTEAWRALGDVLAATGQTENARKAYEKHLRLSIPGVRRLEDAATGPDSELPKAENILRRYLQAHSTDTAALQMLGNVYLRLGRYDDAEKHLSRALELAPHLTSARWMLAGTFYRRTAWDSVLPHLEILLGDDPGNPSYLNLKAHSLLNIGEYAAAIETYEHLVSQHPAAENWMLYGYALATGGQIQGAIAAYRSAIASKPDFGEAYWSLANLKTFRFAPAEINAMKEVLEKRELSPRSRAQLHFALGKALEDEKDFPNSFEQYRQGNAVWRPQVRHDADGVSAFVRRSKALFTAEFFRKRSGAGCTSPDPIFILGLPRSGSTLVEQILSSHPAVEGTRELTVLNSIAKRISDYERHRDSQYPEALAQLGADQLTAAGEEYLSQTRVHRKLGRPFFTDKTPSNFHHLGMIQATLPNAKIIDVRRHPLGCGFAIYKQYFPYGQSFAFDLAEIGRYYRDYVEFMAYFDSVLPGRIHRIFYEDLVNGPEREIRKLLEYCGLPFEERCLRFYETDRGILTPSAEQVRQPIFTGALGQWRNYEPWLGPLKAALGDVLKYYPDAPKAEGRTPAVGSQWSLAANYRISANPPAP